MIVSINQPAYLPWLGYFQRIAASDLHVVLDHVQFEKNSFVNRNKIKTSAGPRWLSVPVRTGGRFGNLALNRIEIDDASPWRKKHWRTLHQSYVHAPHFDAHARFFEALYARPWPLLADLCRESTQYLLDAFGLKTPLRRSSDLAPAGAKDEMVLNLCVGLGADRYLSGPLGRNYLREDRFRDAGVAVQYQDYRHPQYPQAGSGPFVPQLAAVDLLFNCGPQSLKILCRDQPSPAGLKV